VKKRDEKFWGYFHINTHAPLVDSVGQVSAIFRLSENLQFSRYANMLFI
jgi:hypothetical protein